MKKNIACIVMASGHSTRFGSNKLLVEYEGTPLAQHIIEKLRKLSIDIVVVTRYKEIQDLCCQLKVSCLLHNLPYQNDTVRLGLKQLGPSYLGYMFCTGDQPLVQLNSLEKLCADFLEQPNYIHRLKYQDIPGNPVIFPAEFYDKLCDLPQDQGGSYIIKQNKNQLRFTEAGSESELYDIDTTKDLVKLKQLNP